MALIRDGSRVGPVAVWAQEFGLVESGDIVALELDHSVKILVRRPIADECMISLYMVAVESLQNLLMSDC